MKKKKENKEDGYEDARKMDENGIFFFTIIVFIRRRYEEKCDRLITKVYQFQGLIRINCGQMK